MLKSGKRIKKAKTSYGSCSTDDPIRLDEVLKNPEGPYYVIQDPDDAIARIWDIMKTSSHHGAKKQLIYPYTEEESDCRVYDDHPWYRNYWRAYGDLMTRKQRARLGKVSE